METLGREGYRSLSLCRISDVLPILGCVEKRAYESYLTTLVESYIPNGIHVISLSLHSTCFDRLLESWFSLDSFQCWYRMFGLSIACVPCFVFQSLNGGRKLRFIQSYQDCGHKRITRGQTGEWTRSSVGYCMYRHLLICRIIPI